MAPPVSGQVVLAVLGGSSAFTPGLARTLADWAEALPALEVRLFGRSEARLAGITHFCNRHVRARSIPHEYSYTCSLKEAVKDARIVINQMRVGGWQGRSHDDLFPLDFGLPGDETIGPGGLASAIRGLPVVLDAARATARHAPEAWFINMSNPMGILLAGLQQVEGLNSFGLCELPLLTLEKALALADVPLEEVEADYLGLNHQGWFVRLVLDGRDLMPDIFKGVDAPEAARFFRVDGAVMEKLHALPMPYMRLFYHTEREVEKLKARASSRGEELAVLSGELFDHYDRTEDSELPALIRGRGLLWFGMALVPAVSALLGGGEQCLYVTERNGGDLPGLPPEAVVEKRCLLGPEGAARIPFQGPPPVEGGALEPFLSFLRKVIRFEEAALAAALEPGTDTVVDALRRHPLGIDASTALAMAPLVLKPVERSPERQEGGGGKP